MARVTNYWSPNRRMMGSRSRREQATGAGKQQGRPGQISVPANDRYGRELMRPEPTPRDYLGITAGVRPADYGGTAIVPTTYPPAIPTTYQGAGLPGTPGGGTGGTQQLGQTVGTDIFGAPMTGFGQPFAPGQAGMIFDQPQVMLMQAMKNMGYDPLSNQGVYQSMLPLTDYITALTGIALGQGADYGTMANQAALDFAGQYLTQMMTPGGQNINFNAGLAGLNAAALNPGSVLGKFLNVEDPRAQISNYKSVALPLAAASLHPLAARAFQNALNLAGDQYLYNMAGPNMQAGGGQFGAFLSPSLGF